MSKTLFLLTMALLFSNAVYGDQGIQYCQKITDSDMRKVCLTWHSASPSCGPILNANWKHYCHARITSATSLGLDVYTTPFQQIRAAQLEKCKEITDKNMQIYCISGVILIRDPKQDPCVHSTDPDWAELCRTETYHSQHPLKGQCDIKDGNLLNLCKALQ